MQVCVMIIHNNAHVPLEVVTRVILHALGTGNHPVGNDMYIWSMYCTSHLLSTYSRSLSPATVTSHLWFVLKTTLKEKEKYYHLTYVHTLYLHVHVYCTHNPVSPHW